MNFLNFHLKFLFIIVYLISGLFNSFNLHVASCINCRDLGIEQCIVFCFIYFQKSLF